MIRPVNWALGRFFRGFNSVFDRITRVYGKTVAWCLRLSVIMLLIYIGLIALTGYGFARIPQGFIPVQDKGRLNVMVQLPDSASLERTVEVMKKVDKIALETPGVGHIITNPGRSFVLNAISSNLGSGFLPLKPFHERRDPSEKPPTPSPPSCASGSSKKSLKPASPSSARRRWTGWAMQAASN